VRGAFGYLYGSALLMQGSNGLTKTPGAGGQRVRDIPQPPLAGPAASFPEITFQQRAVPVTMGRFPPTLRRRMSANPERRSL
jgi:hypothetical protein